MADGEEAEESAVPGDVDETAWKWFHISRVLFGNGAGDKSFSTDHLGGEADPNSMRERGYDFTEIGVELYSYWTELGNAVRSMVDSGSWSGKAADAFKDLIRQADPKLQSDIGLISYYFSTGAPYGAILDNAAWKLDHARNAFVDLMYEASAQTRERYMQLKAEWEYSIMEYLTPLYQSTLYTSDQVEEARYAFMERNPPPEQPWTGDDIEGTFNVGAYPDIDEWTTIQARAILDELRLHYRNAMFDMEPPTNQLPGNGSSTGGPDSLPTPPKLEFEPIAFDTSNLPEPPSIGGPDGSPLSSPNLPGAPGLPDAPGLSAPLGLPEAPGVGGPGGSLPGAPNLPQPPSLPDAPGVGSALGLPGGPGGSLPGAPGLPQPPSVPGSVNGSGLPGVGGSGVPGLGVPLMPGIATPNSALSRRGGPQLPRLPGAPQLPDAPRLPNGAQLPNGTRGPGIPGPGGLRGPGMPDPAGLRLPDGPLNGARLPAGLADKLTLPDAPPISKDRPLVVDHRPPLGGSSPLRDLPHSVLGPSGPGGLGSSGFGGLGSRGAVPDGLHAPVAGPGGLGAPAGPGGGLGAPTGPGGGLNAAAPGGRMSSGAGYPGMYPPMMPPMAGGGQGTQDKERTVWCEDDRDLFRPGGAVTHGVIRAGSTGCTDEVEAVVETSGESVTFAEETPESQHEPQAPHHGTA